MPFTRVLQRLGLASDASPDAALSAIEALHKECTDSATKFSAVSAQLDEAKKTLATERATHEALKASLSQRDEDEFIASGIQAGKVRPGSKFEAAMRKLYAMDHEAAQEQLDTAPVLTPVGKPRQSDKPPAPEDGPDALTREQLKNAGVKDPDAYYAKHAQT